MQYKYVYIYIDDIIIWRRSDKTTFKSFVFLTENINTIHIKSYLYA
jgi:hypothetical protein